MKKSLICQIVFVITFCVSTVASAGPLYFACVLGCCGLSAALSLATGPLAPGAWTAACATCVANCAPAAAGCFATDTTITALEDGVVVGKNIETIRSGDVIRTLDNTGKLVWTNVVRNTKTSGEFEFIQIDAKSEKTGNDFHLKVTPAHGVIMNSNNGTLTLDTSSHTLVGDKIIGSDGDILSVINVSKVNMQDKYTLETVDGTVLASGVFVATICDEEILGGERLLEPQLIDWKARHPYLDKVEDVERSKQNKFETTLQ